MDKIYSGAVLTISSAESPNSWSGIFAQREQYRSVPLYLSSFPGLRLRDVHVCVLPSLGDVRDPYEDLEESNLNGRAWALQERILSPAILHFTRHALIWECRTHSCTEDGHVSSCHPFSKHLTGHGSSVHGDPFLTWYVLVEDYTRRKLMYESDKMPALDGLAKHFPQKYGVYRYLAGLWEEDLARGLLWSRRVSLTEIANRAPSWAWVSREGEVSYGIGDLSQPAIIKPDLDLQILNSGSGEAVKDGLHAEGFLQETIFDPLHQHDTTRPTAGFNGHLSFWMDDSFEGPCWCLCVRAQLSRAPVPSRAQAYVTFLVLEKVSEDNTKVFKRTGLASIPFDEERTSVMTSPARTRLTLV
jgi:hypothetical protein